jgi:hypothetical protein
MDIVNDIDVILKNLNRNSNRKKQTSLEEWMDNNTDLLRFMNEDVNDKELFEISFTISPQTKKMLDIMLKKYGTHKLEHLCKIYMIYSLCLNWNTDDKRKKLLNTPKQGETI